MAKRCGIVLLGFWSGAVLVMIRRPSIPTETDKRLIQYAFVPLFAVSVVISLVMQR